MGTSPVWSACSIGRSPPERLRLVPRWRNRRCQQLAGCQLLDLPARDWRAEYDGRVPPEEAADVAVDEYAAVHGT